MSRDAGNLILRVKASSLQSSRATTDVREAAARIAPKLDFPHMWPAARMKALEKTSGAHGPAHEFLRDWPTPKCAEIYSRLATILLVSSQVLFELLRINDDARFSGFEKKTVLLRRSSIFNDGRTFENYIGFLWKACFFFWTSP